MADKAVDLLTAFKAKRAELGTKALAESLGIKESAVRMIATGNYPNPAKILALFARRHIDTVDCPYAGRALERDDCVRRSTAPRPCGGSAKQLWWEACQTCVFKEDADHE